jgi:hypothetical protein
LDESPKGVRPGEGLFPSSIEEEKFGSTKDELVTDKGAEGMIGGSIIDLAIKDERGGFIEGPSVRDLFGLASLAPSREGRFEVLPKRLLMIGLWENTN